MKKLFLLTVMIMVIASCYGQYTPLPYFNGFENPQDTVGWTFKKRVKTTGFEVGSATHCLGYKSMYISPDSGTTATYSTTASGYMSMAYKSFTLPAGTYTLAFDYQCGGDGSNQDMKVAWVPASTTLTAAAVGTTYSNAIQLNQFTDDSNVNTFGLSAWRHVTGTVTVPAGGGTYNLCFAFRSNSTVVSAPGACVDNIQVDTVHSNTDCVATPTDITVVKDNQYGIIITWNGNATEYEVVAASASDPDDYSFCQHTGITTTSDTMQYSELGEGQYFFYVRAICDSDTSIYGEISDVLIYDVSGHCIDYVTFNAPGTTCTYGTHDNPYQTTGFIDNGPSQMSSRHTVHTDLNETDPRTNGALHTVPIGEIMSVRLGNWNNGSEAESVTYTYNVPAGSNLILMMKYAVVFEEPGHDEPPEFKLEIMNANNQLLDPVCTVVNPICRGTLADGWHNCTSSNSNIWWKEWTSIGVNLASYANQTVKIRLTTMDCNFAGHFGYAYFTLDCAQAELTYGSYNPTEIKAPDGFNYQWTNSCTGQEVSTSQVLPVTGKDTCTYICRCSFIEQPSCYFELTYNSQDQKPENKKVVTVNVNDASMGYVTGGGTYTDGDMVTLKAVANSNCRFIKWSNEATTPSFTFTVDRDTAFTAYFERCEDMTVEKDTIIYEGQSCDITIYDSGNQVIDTSFSSTGNYVLTYQTANGCYATQIIHLDVIGTTDNENITSFNIDIIPNPTNSGETVTVFGNLDEITSVEIVNSFGQVMCEFVPTAYPIELKGLEQAGIYYVRVTTATGEVCINKLIVK